MFLPVLKRFVIIIFMVAFALFAGAQQTHFIYLQTEDGQPFYIKMNNKIVSSSSAGYLILPKLVDGKYKLSIGFPKKEFPEENFEIVVDKRNEGLLLKNFGEKGWGLFDMQSYNVVMGGNTAAIASPPKNLQDDPFSKLLANVVKDSSILQKNEPVKKETPAIPKADSAVTKVDSPIARIDSPLVKVDSNVVKVNSTAAIAEKTGATLFSPATRLLSKKDKDGRELIYIDHGETVNDTIRIFIPSQKPVIKSVVSDSSSVAKNETPSNTLSVDTSQAVNKDTVVQNTKPSISPLSDSVGMAAGQPASPQVKRDSNQVVFTENKTSVENKDTVITKKKDEIKPPETRPEDVTAANENKAAATKKDDLVVLPKVVQSSTTNSDCKAFASNEDFLKLRKKMAAEKSDDDMIKVAKKSFHLKCFSTEQIKNLSFLFLTNAGKYVFFDTAYPFAADSDQYNTLQSQLTDSYYLNRFNAMIHK